MTSMQLEPQWMQLKCPTLSHIVTFLYNNTEVEYKTYTIQAVSYRTLFFFHSELWSTCFAIGLLLMVQTLYPVNERRFISISRNLRCFRPSYYVGVPIVIDPLTLRGISIEILLSLHHVGFTHQGYENKGNDHKLKKLLNSKQILLRKGCGYSSW